MKVRTLQRRTGDTSRECIGDIRKQSRNLDPKMHPMQRAREYQRAKTAAKLERMFAKPFIGDFKPGHSDAVTCCGISRKSLLPLISGAADGSVKLWDVTSRKQMANIANSHGRVVNGVVFNQNGQKFYSCSDDGYIHCWSLHPQQHHSSSSAIHSQSSSSSCSSSSSPHGPLLSWRGSAFKSMDHHWQDSYFATASSDCVQIWSPERTTAIAEYSDLWGSADSVTIVKYNPAERSLLAQCSADRGVGLHDTRTNSDLKKTILRMRSNDLCWNPLEPMMFVVANEDYNCYSFDMRNLSAPTKIYKGHEGAVMSVSYSPTGREFVTGSYDRSIRIFPVKGGMSREIYHTKRMQRIFTVQYTMDNKYIVSGSDDSNLRLWKAHASDHLGQMSTREESARNYRTALVKRYEHLPEIRRISKARKIPKAIRNQARQQRIVKESQQRKQANRVKYSKNGEHKFIPEKEKTIVKEVE